MRSAKNAITDSVNVKLKLISDKEAMKSIDEVVEACIKALKNGNSIYWCGNGGSAADAQHLAAELSGRFYFDRDPLPSDALHCNTSYLTAVGNDYGYHLVYSRLIKGLGREGDVLIGLSTSGNSANVLNAFLEANKKGMVTIGMTGKTGGEFDNNVCKHMIKVPSTDTPRIQECHITIGHIICEQIEETLFGETKS
jgi:D-sedoheptulose 7-phosphate isomerase